MNEHLPGKRASNSRPPEHSDLVPGQLAGLEEVLRKVATAMGKVVARTADEENDMVEFAKDLGNIGSSASIFGDNDFFFEGSKEVARSEK